MGASASSLTPSTRTLSPRDPAPASPCTGVPAAAPTSASSRAGAPAPASERAALALLEDFQLGVAPHLPPAYFGGTVSGPLPARLAEGWTELFGGGLYDGTVAARTAHARVAAGLGQPPAVAGAVAGVAAAVAAPRVVHDGAYRAAAAAALSSSVTDAARPALLLEEGLLCEDARCCEEARVFCTCCRITGALRCAAHDRARHSIVRGQGRAILAPCEGGRALKLLDVDEFINEAGEVVRVPLAMPEVSCCPTCGSSLVEAVSITSSASRRYDAGATYLVAPVSTWRCMARRATGSCMATWTSPRGEWMGGASGLSWTGVPSRAHRSNLLLLFLPTHLQPAPSSWARRHSLLCGSTPS